MTRSQGFQQAYQDTIVDVVARIESRTLSEEGGNAAMHCSTLMLIGGELAYMNDLLGELVKIVAHVGSVLITPPQKPTGGSGRF